MENKDLLRQVEEAISKITLTGQSYKIGSRSLTRADLAELRAMRKELKQEIASGADGNQLTGFFVAEFNGR